MASTEQVGAALARAAERNRATTNQIRAAVEGTGQIVVRLQMVAGGTSRPISDLG